MHNEKNVFRRRLFESDRERQKKNQGNEIGQKKIKYEREGERYRQNKGYHWVDR